MTDWAHQLNAQGLRATPAAQAVLAELHQAATTLSHDELLARLQQRLGQRTPDRVTLYRILERLLVKGLIAASATTGRARRFSVRPAAVMAQFECNLCHRITPLPDDPHLQGALAVIQQRLHRLGATAIHQAIAAHGVCADCGGRRV